MAVEEERRALALDRGRQRLGAIDPAALVRRRQPQQHGGDVGCAERIGEPFHEPGGSCGATR